MTVSSFQSFHSLDASQRKFCELPGDAIRLLAPAGSGKTHALLWRCRKLVHDDPETKILMFTFTRAARDELLERLKLQNFAHLQNNVTITTLNSYGFQIVQKLISNSVLLTNKTEIQNCKQILMPIWKKYPMIRALLESKSSYHAWSMLFVLSDRLKTLGFRHNHLDTFAKFYGHIALLSKIGMGMMLKTIFQEIFELKISEQYRLDDLQQLWLMREVEETYKTHVATVLQDIYENYIRYWCESTEQLIQCGMITLEDQKYIARLYLQNKLNRGEVFSGKARTQHIFVDEFQDINPLDLAMLRAMAQLNRTNLTIVGDDDQAIYEWRGASPAFILAPERFLGSKYVTRLLSTNYRSPRNIVELSQRLIDHNKHRLVKHVTAASQSSAHIEIMPCSSVSDAIDATVRKVLEILPSGQSIALITRKRSQLIPYQIVFAGLGIPFCAAEDLQIFLSKAFHELSDCIQICDRIHQPKSFLIDPRDLILMLCDKIKRYPLSKVERAALSQYLLSRSPKTLIEALAYLREYHGSLKGNNSDARQSKKFADVLKILFDANTVSESIAVFGDYFEGLQKDYGKSDDDIFYTDPPFIYLADFAKKYGNNYQQFCFDIEKTIHTLADGSNNFQNEIDPIWNRQLHLMTALRAKGREFDTVFILDAVDGIWPSKQAITESELEQERRLFYVAMTRAKKQLLFVYENRFADKVFNVTPYLHEIGLL